MTRAPRSALAAAASRAALAVLGLALGVAIAEAALRLGLPVGAYLPEHVNQPGKRVSGTRVPGTRRIVVLGDSMCAYPGSWPDRLQAVLDKTAPGRAEIVNDALPGTGPDTYRNVLSLRGLAVAPDVVLVMAYVGNDLQDVRDWQRQPAPRRALRDWLRRHSYLAWFIRETWLRKLKHLAQAPRTLTWRQWAMAAGAERGVPDKELKRRLASVESVLPKRAGAPPINTYLLEFAVAEPGRFRSSLDLSDASLASAMDASEGLLEEMRGMIRSRGAAMALVVAPSCLQVNETCAAFFRSIGYDVPKDMAGLDAPNRRWLAWAERAGVPALDLREALRRPAARPLYRTLDDHWNAQGAQVVAEAIARFLRDKGLAP
ncbi:MAG: hypothetical protein HY078_14885 [Elusimicrobia bacterium]|nr:hypothetical protein [Elusimicrobiota bacterium]